MEVQYKRYKSTHKDFYRWIVNEIEGFFPEIKSKDPLKRLSHLLDPDLSTSLPDPEQLLTKPSKAKRTLKHEPNFSICKYWKDFPSQLNETMLEFLDLKDIVMLMETCKYFKETLDQRSTWKFLQIREFSGFGLKMLRDDTKDRISEKLYYKYLYLSMNSGIPYHTGYFKTYGSSDVAELSEFIVDFLCPKREVIKNYVGEILARNQCKTFDLKLSWLKEKNEICLWNGNFSLEFKTRQLGYDIDIIHKFYPCFIKRYSIIGEDEKITKIFFLEDRYLVVKLKRKLETGEIMTVFRILDFEEELYAIAKGLEPAIPFDYSFMRRKVNDRNLTDIKASEFGVDFEIDQETGCYIKVKLLSGDRVVFYTQNSVKPTMIFWDLKEQKKIDFVSVELQKPLNSIIVSKRSEGTVEIIPVFLLDEDMNVYCGSVSEKDGFIINQTIILPTPVDEKEKEIEKPQEDNDEKLQEIEAKYNLNFGKKTRSKYVTGRYPTYLPADSLYDLPKPIDLQLSEKTRRYYHEFFSKTNEEWLIVNVKNNLHFINLDKGKIQEFSSDTEIGILHNGNWTVYEDNLLITNPANILYYKINFEDHSISFRFSRETQTLVEKIGKQWIILDPCFTVMVFTHIYQLGFTTKATIIVTSTQQFLYNQDPALLSFIIYKVQADEIFSAPDRSGSIDRYLDVKLENSKVLVKTNKASFYFDMSLSTLPSIKVDLDGWMSYDPIHIIRAAKLVITEAKKLVVVEKEEKPKQRMVNNMKLKENLNTMNAKEKNDGWKKGGKSQAKKEEDKEYKVLKGKGEKYHKNIRQGQRSDKVN